MYTTCSELVVFMYRTGKSMNNLLTYCGIVDARIRASNKDLPVTGILELFCRLRFALKETLQFVKKWITL